MFKDVVGRVRYRDANPTIKRGYRCFICEKALTEEDTMFVDVFSGSDEEPKTHCLDCENKALEVENATSLANDHYCYKITPKSKNFDLLAFGPNEF